MQSRLLYILETVKYTASACLAAAVFVSGSVHAQTPQIEFQVDPVVDSAKIKAAAEKADTGRMAPGYRDLSRYDSPGYCLESLRGHTKLIWRKAERDSLRRSSSSDTLPTQARITGRSCLEKFKIAQVPQSELLNFVKLALLTGDTSKADSAIEHWLKVSPSDTRSRGFIVFDVIQTALTNPPFDINIANRWLNYFDSLGNEALEPKILAYGQIHGFAVNTFDTANMIRLSAIKHSLLNNISPESAVELDGLVKGSIYGDSIAIAFYKLQQPELTDVISRLADNYAEANDNAQGIKLLSELTKLNSTLNGTKLPDFPYLKKYPDSASELITPGHVTIMAWVKLGNGRLDSFLASLRRMHEKYANQGLDVVLIANTSGFAWASPPLESSDEANVIGWYFRDHLKLPFKVVVEDTEFYNRADGRRINAPSNFRRLYHPMGSSRILIRRDGNISNVNIGFSSEAEMEAYIVRELNRK